MMVTMRSSSSVVSSPALQGVRRRPFDAACVYIPLVQVHIGLLANKVGVAASNTFDLRQGVHDLLLSINVGIEETQDKLEVRLFAADKRPVLDGKQPVSIYISYRPLSSAILGPTIYP